MQRIFLLINLYMFLMYKMDVQAFIIYLNSTTLSIIPLMILFLKTMLAWCYPTNSAQPILSNSDDASKQVPHGALTAHNLIQAKNGELHRNNTKQAPWFLAYTVMADLD